MKKTLLTALLLVASATAGLAQGFRVYRSDGAVYQFSFVADSIAFYEGSGDPNYEEPVPESVKKALADLQTYIDELHKRSAMHDDIIAENTERIVALQYINKENEARIEALEAETNTLKKENAVLGDRIYDLEARIKDLEAHLMMLEDALNKLSQ